MATLGNNWDEGLIKNGTGESALGRGGFGIHMHESRMFTFWSTSWNPLLSIQGGTGNIYIKGNTGVGTMTPEVKLQVKSDNAGTGANTNNWIAGSFGGQAGTRVVLGNLYGTATIGAHTDIHNGWANLAINTDAGNVGIGTATPDAKLAVRGTIHIQEVKVDMNGWVD